MAEAAERGLSYDETKALFPDVDAATVETRKSLYEEFGLLYVAKYSGTPHLTGVGRQLFNLLGMRPPSDPSEEVRIQVDSLLCWAVSHTQINRPQSLGSPNITEEERADCDIRPYAAFWQAMLELGGTVTFEEFNNVLAHVQRVDHFESAVQTIMRARESGALPEAVEKSDNFGIYWRAHLSLARAVLNIRDGQFSFVPNRERIIRSILEFQTQRESSDASAAIRSKWWADVDEYYLFAGQECPEFIASGQPTVESPASPNVGLGVRPLPTPILRVVALQPQTRVPRGTNSAPAVDQSRAFHRATGESQTPP